MTPVTRALGLPGPSVASNTYMAEVLYIGAVGRSGSTLLERLLGVARRPVPLGELVHLWERGLARNEPCSCWEPFRSCPFWSEVGHAAFGGWDRLDPGGVNALRHQVDRTRYLPWLARPSLAPRRGRTPGSASSATCCEPLYGAFAQTCGPDAVPGRRQQAPVRTPTCCGTSLVYRMRVVHLVRDPAGEWPGRGRSR